MKIDGRKLAYSMAAMLMFGIALNALSVNNLKCIDFNSYTIGCSTPEDCPSGWGEDCDEFYFDDTVSGCVPELGSHCMTSVLDPGVGITKYGGQCYEEAGDCFCYMSGDDPEYSTWTISCGAYAGGASPTMTASVGSLGVHRH